ncbi:MAG: hypothetical protein RL571_1101 [Pseudomonadota bacterium]|jgi:ribosomal protein S27AE
MSFDYGSDSNKFNLPNPMRLENIFLLLCGSALLIAGLLLLLMVKQAIAAETIYYKLAAVLLAVAMLGAGVSLLGWAMRQLRFFFGRGRPVSLADEVPNGMQGKSPSSDSLREVLRQQALVYQEPQGALSTLLHSIVPNLTFAPERIRNLALLHFKKGITLLMVLAVLVLSLVGGKAHGPEWQHIANWIGLAFMGYVVWLLLAPVNNALGLSLRDAEQTLSPSRLVMMLVLAILGPVILLKLAPKLPDVAWLDPFPQVFVLIVLALAVYSVFYLALLRNVKQPPNTMVSNKQDTWSINCHPGLALEEFAREMQNNWQESIPNRTYSRLEPHIDLNEKSGRFYAEALEETQPLPIDAAPVLFASALASPRLKPLLLLDLIGTSFVLLATVLFTLSGMQILSVAASTFNANLLTYGAVFFALGVYAISSAHQLWQRFEFKSQLISIEMSGHYVTAQLDHGNVLKDSIKTNSHVVQIESMTFRLWLTELTSVTFQNGSQRYALSLVGNAERAEQLLRHFKKFAHDQAIILAPKAQADQQRHAVLGQFNQAAAWPDAPEGMAISQGEGVLIDTAVVDVAPALKRPKFCSKCGNATLPDALFCGECGEKITEA